MKKKVIVGGSLEETAARVEDAWPVLLSRIVSLSPRREL